MSSLSDKAILVEMISKLLYGISSRRKEGKIESVKPPRETVFNSDAMNHNNEFLLLPEESCLVEDEKSVFHVHYERAGFHLFGRRDVDFHRVAAKIYLTNYRLIFVPRACAKQRYPSFSICIEALREPHLRPYDIYGVKNCLDFSVSLEHGRVAAERHPDTCKTVGELVDPRFGQISSQSHSIYNCKVLCVFQRPGKAKMFLKGINLMLADGQACPTQQCRFIEYEDLPLYNSASPPAFDEFSVDKLEMC